MASKVPASDFSNSILICVDCEEEFVFTASAQKYFAERGFTEPPKRCKSCYNDYRKGESNPVDESPDGDMPPPDMEDGASPTAGDRV